MPSFCTKCGYQNADLSAFCELCGKPLAARHGTIPSSLAVIAVDDTIDPKANIGAGSPAEGSESSEQWECRTCKALNQQDNDTCWNCQRTKASPAVKLVDDALKSPFLDRLTTQVLAIIGGLMFLFGLIRFNSLGSQMVRGFGGSDNVGVVFMILGGLLVVIGGYPLLGSQSTRTDARTATPQVPARDGTSTVVSSNQLANEIEQLERLAALRDRGVLSDQEFDAQKKKLLD